MYNKTVRIGNWFEDVEIEKEKAAEFIKKRESCQLLIQRTRKLFDNLLRQVRLSNRDDFVKYESCIQLKAPDMLRFPVTGITNRNIDDFTYGVVLCGTVHEKHIEKISKLVGGCRLVGSPLPVPCVRNTFVIKSSDDCEKSQQNLLFGEQFVLQLADSEELLYVRAEKPPINGDRGPFGHCPVRLSNKKDRYSLWKVLSWDKNLRFESENTPVPPFTRVLIQNVMSGLDLAVEGTIWWLSIFGNECGLSVHTYVNSSKRETAECLWMFVTNESTESSSISDE